MVCAAPSHKTAVQNYAAANRNAYFLHKRFPLKPEFNCADTGTEYQMKQRTAELPRELLAKGE